MFFRFALQQEARCLQECIQSTQKITKTRKPSSSAETMIEFKCTAVLLYVKALSEQLPRYLQQQGIRAVFKSETTFISHLVRPTDRLNKMAWFTGFPVNAVKSTSARQICPYIKQMELSVVGWEVIELGRYNCRSLRQLIIRDVTMSLSKLKVDCPTLEYFKCSGDVSPAKQKNSRSVAGCDIEIHAKSLRKFQMCDVGSANCVTLSCIEANVIQIKGIQPWRRPLFVELKASRLIDTISLKGVTIDMIYIKSTSVENIIIEKCSLAGNSKNGRTMRFRCDEIRALRLLRCPRMKRFSLHVKGVQNLSIDSCANVRDLDVSASRLCYVRIDNCPYLEQIHEAISHHSSDFSLSHFSDR